MPQSTGFRSPRAGRPRRVQLLARVAASCVLAPTLVVLSAGVARAADAPPPATDPSDDATSSSDCVRLTSIGAPATPLPTSGPVLAQVLPLPAFSVNGFPRSWWTSPPTTDPSWQMYFYGLSWMMPLARSAHQEHNQYVLKTLVDVTLAFHSANPDRGTSRNGWDEGTAQRRLQSLNCLYGATHDPRLLPVIEAAVNVQLGPRYYGPPYHPVHNHGLMANLRMLEAARLTARDDWRGTAERRIELEAQSFWTPAGLTHEQSSEYQAVDIGLWESAMQSLADINPATPAIGVIRGLAAKAHTANQWLTEPDGRIVQLGDSERVAGERPTTATGRAFRDDAAGVFVGRSSWTDPAATYLTLRYGGPMRMHGHQERTGVTWSTAGSRVLVGTGVFSYDVTDRFFPMQSGPAGANVSVPERAGALRPGASVTLTSAKSTAAGYTLTTADQLYLRSHTRTVMASAANRTLSVRDAYAGGRGGVRQLWHLDPTWSLIGSSAHAATFRSPAGRRLTVTTSGSVALLRGATRPPAGFVFLAFRQRVPAWQLSLHSTTGTISTSFAVR